MHFGRAPRCAPWGISVDYKTASPHVEKTAMKKTWKQISPFVLLFLFIHAPSASALTIVTHFIGGNPPSNAAGGGNLDEIVNAAASIWESAYSDPFVLTIYYGWGQAEDAGGDHTLQQSDASGRETCGLILFDNSGTVPFYLDPTPNSNEEYRQQTEEYQDLGSGLVNVATVFSKPTGDAAGHVDLLSVALHEMGHALGLSSANVNFISQSSGGLIDISGSYPFSGTAIPLIYNNSGIVPHFDLNQLAYGSLMSGINADERRMPSELDLLADAQVSSFAIAAAQSVTAPVSQQSGGARNQEPGTRNGIRGRVALAAASPEISSPAVLQPVRDDSTY